MVSLEPWRNSTPFFGAAVFCTTNIDNMVEEAIEEGPAIRKPRATSRDVERHS